MIAIVKRVINYLFGKPVPTALPPFPVPAPLSNGMQVHFSPKGSCTQAAVDYINNAKTSIYMLAYYFTSKPIYEALVAASKRGVHIEAIFDKPTIPSRGELSTPLHAAGIPCYADAAHVIAHNKVLIIDGSIVITGSFNWTAAAENVNAENLLMIPSAELAAVYMENWNYHKSHSTPF